ncbi:MAG: T9SS type A sorting domain-containing protein [Bacteroidales bacterium]|nr:T9SS type A sorting domain-containing protein [Bacteroidales bacterium]
MKRLIFTIVTLALPALILAQQGASFSREPADISGDLPYEKPSVLEKDPMLTGINPDSGTISETLTVQISGQETHFMASSTTVWFSLGSNTIYPYSTYPLSNELLEASFYFYFWDLPGIYDVNTYNNYDGHLFLTDAFELLPDPNGPYLTSVEPDTAVSPETLSVTITGENTHFNQGTSTGVWLQQASQTIWPQDLYIQSATKMVADFDFKFDHLPGIYDVFALDEMDGLMALTESFNLLPNPEPPHITEIEPDQGHQGDSLEVAISGQGTHFSEGSVTVVFKQGSYTLYPYNVEVLDDDHLNALYYINPNAWLGLYDFEYFSYMYGPAQVEDAFMVLPPLPPAPEILSMNPDEGFQAIEIIMAIVGDNTHFLSGADLNVWFGNDTLIHEADTIMPFSEEGMVIQFMFPYTVPLGEWSLNVFNDEDSLLVAEDIFLLKENPDQPAILSIDPDSAVVGNPVFVTIEAENSHFAESGVLTEVWLEKGEKTIDGEGETPQGNTILGTNFVIPADADTGWYDLHLQNSFDGHLVLAEAFTVADSIDFIPERIAAPGINIFPNPGTGMFNLVVTGASKTDITVLLIDAAGRKQYLLERKDISVIREIIDLSDRPAGIYYLQVIPEKGVPAARKLVISK